MVDTFDYRLPSNTSIICSASASSGKSTLCLEIIKRRREIFKTPIECVIYVYQNYQDDFAAFESDPLVVFVSDYKQVDSELERNSDKPHLVVFDDKLILFESDRDFAAYVESFFIYKASHLAYTPIFIVHSLFPPKLRLISLNCKLFILFKNIRDVSQSMVLGNQIGVGSLIKRALDHLTKTNNYGFLLCDLSMGTEDRFRFRNFIWPTDDMMIFTP